jgi:hypothetical protein
LSASEYLETNGPAELALRKGGLSEKAEALERLSRSGALNRGETAIEYKKLISGLRPLLKLYKDKRDDEVKSAISAATGRSCNYQTARDFLKRAWVLNPSRYTWPELRTTIDSARNPWNRWCDAYTLVRQDKENRTHRFLLIPGELLEAALRLRRRRQRKQ